jgi:hypothetical protein
MGKSEKKSILATVRDDEMPAITSFSFILLVGFKLDGYNFLAFSLPSSL